MYVRASQISSLLILLCVFSLPLHAKPTKTVYQVELIFFRQAHAWDRSSEQWPEHVGTLPTSKALSLARAEEQGIILGTLPSTEFNLKDEARKLGRAKPIIAHTGWLQALELNKRSKTLLLEAGANADRVQALVSIKQLRNNFELSIDYVYSNDSDAQQYRHTRDYKIKSRDLVYIDHPKLAALVMITPAPQD